MEHFIKNIHNCFNQFMTNKCIHKYKIHNKNIKIDLKYIILHTFLNTFMSKEQATEKLNNYISYNRTSFYRQEKQISICFYEDLNKHISSICNKCINIKSNTKHKYTFVAIDGTYSNGQNYKNSLNMGYFDIINDIPIEIELKGIEYKNREVKSLIEKIKSNFDSFTNKVIVVDRLYFCYDFIVFLLQNNIKFIIRCKGECTKLKDITNDNKLISEIRKNTRLITFDDYIYKTILVKNKAKNKKSKIKMDIKIKNNCTLITNLSKHFNNEKILNLYKMRWNVETYFKLVKHNFDFQHSTHKKDIDIKKHLLCINIICSICKIFNMYLSETKKKEHEDCLDDIIIKCNETKLMRFFENYLLKNLIVDKKLPYLDFTKNIKPYLEVRKYKKNESNPRNCKTPFMKWYIKAYSNQSEIINILLAIENGTINNIHSNLKTKAKKITILAKKYI